MPEGMNVELAHQLSESESSARRHHRWEEAIEIAEVIVLAVVAVATAFSGFQAAKWDGRQTLLYGRATSDRFVADAQSTYGGQRLAADADFFTAWLQARAANDTQLESDFVRRFSPEYRIAFSAWLATNPFSNPRAPAGPGAMPQYHNPYFAKAAQLNAKASSEFAQGTAASNTGDKYVRDTVLFASVLFLVALAQRLKIREARIGLNTAAACLLVYLIVSLIVLPRL